MCRVLCSVGFSLRGFGPCKDLTLWGLDFAKAKPAQAEAYATGTSTPQRGLLYD